jgi:hypothetical protein
MPHNAQQPACVLVTGSQRYSRTVIRHLSFENHLLTIDLQGVHFSYARLLFRDVVGFRVLDERDLTEFWNAYSEPNGWLWEVKSGGWFDLERRRSTFNSGSLFPGLREFFVVDDQCVSVLCPHAPELVDLGSDPTAA